MKKARIEEIQYLRGLAFLAVVLQHSIAHYAGVPDVTLADGVLLALLLLAVKFAVPMFVFITGLVLFYNYSSGDFKYLTFIRRRLQDIIVPYLIWSLVYGLFYQAIQPGFWPEVQNLLRMFVTGKAQYHLWYVIAVFQFYLLFPVFRGLIHAVRQRVSTQTGAFLWMLLVGAFYLFLSNQVGVIGDFMQKLHIPILTPLFTEFADRNFLYFFYYFVAGAVVGLYVERWRELLVRHHEWLTVLFWVVLGYFLYRVTSHDQLVPFKINFNDTFLIQPRMAFFLIVSLPVIYLFAMRIAKEGSAWLMRGLERIGYYSYGAYLIHALMLNYGVALADRLLGGLNPTLRTLLAAALTAWFAVAATVVLSRLPVLGKWVVGLGPQKKVKI